MDAEKDTYTAGGRLLSREETARYLGTTPRSVDRLVGKGVLMSVKLPGLHRVLFDKTDLDRLIDSAKGDGRETAA
jgi:excisionase family DNA binding protein